VKPKSVVSNRSVTKYVYVSTFNLITYFRVSMAEWSYFNNNMRQTLNLKFSKDTKEINSFYYISVILLMFNGNNNNNNNNISPPWIRYEKTKVVSKCSNPGNDNYPLRPLLPGIKIRAREREREKRIILFHTSYLCKTFPFYFLISLHFSIFISLSLSLFNFSFFLTVFLSLVFFSLSLMLSLGFSYTNIFSKWVIPFLSLLSFSHSQWFMLDF